MEKRYLGDGVYIQIVGGMLCLTTEDGISVTNEIYLEPDVFEALVDYGQAAFDEMKNQPEEKP